jgi:hypothetical protein
MTLSDWLAAASSGMSPDDLRNHAQRTMASLPEADQQHLAEAVERLPRSGLLGFGSTA